MTAKHSASPTSYRAFSHSLGQKERLPPPRLSAGCRFTKEPIAGMRPTGETRRLRAFVWARLPLIWSGNPSQRSFGFINQLSHDVGYR
jgi:hypothetical protein